MISISLCRWCSNCHPLCTEPLKNAVSKIAESSIFFTFLAAIVAGGVIGRPVAHVGKDVSVQAVVLPTEEAYSAVLVRVAVAQALVAGVLLRAAVVVAVVVAVVMPQVPFTRR